MTVHELMPADRVDRLADTYMDRVVGHVGDLLVVAVLPGASQVECHTAAAAKIILKQAIEEASAVIAGSEAHRLIIAAPAAGARARRRLALLLAQRRLEVWQKAAASLQLLHRPPAADEPIQ